MTVRLTTLAKAFGEGAAKKPLAGSQLRDPRAKFAFGRREARAMKSRINWFLHLRSIYYLRLSRMSTHKMQCEFAQYLKKGPTVGESNTWITQKLRCGTTGGGKGLRSPRRSSVVMRERQQSIVPQARAAKNSMAVTANYFTRKVARERCRRACDLDRATWIFLHRSCHE